MTSERDGRIVPFSTSRPRRRMEAHFVRETIGLTEALPPHVATLTITIGSTTVVIINRDACGEAIVMAETGT